MITLLSTKPEFARLTLLATFLGGLYICLALHSLAERKYLDWPNMDDRTASVIAFLSRAVNAGISFVIVVVILLWLQLLDVL